MSKHEILEYLHNAGVREGWNNYYLREFRSLDSSTNMTICAGKTIDDPSYYWQRVGSTVCDTFNELVATLERRLDAERLYIVNDTTIYVGLFTPSKIARIRQVYCKEKDFDLVPTLS